MPTAIPDLILCDGQTATGAGSGVIGLGEEMRYANGAGVNRNKTNRKFKVRAVLTDSTTGATATVLIEHCDDNSTWVTAATITLSLVAGTQDASRGMLCQSTKRYIRANVSALAGGSAPAVNAYLTLGTFGS